LRRAGIRVKPRDVPITDPVESMPQPLTWIVTEGLIGLENQALGVAEAVGVEPVVKRWTPQGLRRVLPPRLWPNPLQGRDTNGGALEPPWPDLLITCGGKSAAVGVAIGKASGGRTVTVHVQSPPWPASAFDLVIAPEHDRFKGANVVHTMGAVHRVTPQKLAGAAKAWAPRLAHLPRPYAAVLIGGSNGRYTLTPGIMKRLARDLAVAARDQGVSLLVTPSRRTGAENEAVLRAALTGLNAEIWEGAGENPYFGYLGLADHVIVTCDSVSMVSEAAATGKPVHVIRLEGASRRIDAFHDSFENAGITRAFRGALPQWDYAVPDDTARAAAEVRRHLAARGFD
jgi:mitochondrial fission protein ELM1